MKEEWKSIDGYDGMYDVSSLGRVYSHKVKRTLKLTANSKTGYLQVSLNHRGKATTYNVHRLVAKAFVDNPNSEVNDTVNHLDENKINNVASNLEWTTVYGNLHWGTGIDKIKRSHLEADNSNKVPIIVIKVSSGEEVQTSSLREASRISGVNRSKIRTILTNPDAFNGLSNEYIFKYKDNNRVLKDIEGFDSTTRGANNPMYRTTSDVNSQLKEANKDLVMLSEYTGVHSKAQFKCTKHNIEFERELNTVLNGNVGCPECSKLSFREKRSIPMEEYQARLNSVFNSNLEILSFTTGSEKSLIKCYNCGNEFTRVVKDILNRPRGNGCPKCNKRHTAIVNNMNRAGRTPEQIEHRLNEVGLHW